MRKINLLEELNVYIRKESGGGGGPDSPLPIVVMRFVLKSNLK